MVKGFGVLDFSHTFNISLTGREKIECAERYLYGPHAEQARVLCVKEWLVTRTNTERCRLPLHAVVIGK